MKQSADKAVHLIFNNKINAKNAFDIDTNFVKSLSKIMSEGVAGNEMTWLKASTQLDASAKIYGFRVDLVHHETYKVLGGLHR